MYNGSFQIGNDFEIFLFYVFNMNNITHMHRCNIKNNFIGNSVLACDWWIVVFSGTKPDGFVNFLIFFYFQGLQDAIISIPSDAITGLVISGLFLVKKDLKFRCGWSKMAIGMCIPWTCLLHVKLT